MSICPSCSSETIVKNGRIHNGKQRFKCNECPKGYRFAYNRQFIEKPQKIVIERQKRELIDRLLLEKISRFGNRTCCSGF
jgi:transposase-like protein